MECPDIARRRGRPAARPVQRGLSLIVVMMLLVIISMLGVGSAQISMMSERGARNDRDTQGAFQTAQAALEDAAFEIDSPAASSPRQGAFADGNVIGFEDGCGTGAANRGLCNPTTTGKPAWLQIDFSDPARTTGFGDFTGRRFAAAAGAERGVMPVRAPRYVVEIVSDNEPFHNRSTPQNKLYRVTAMGFGSRRDIQSVVQMLYRKKKD
jgi:type IV pilus assembly protein PilX